jgi:hypothetical protein
VLNGKNQIEKMKLEHAAQVREDSGGDKWAKCRLAGENS